MISKEVDDFIKSEMKPKDEYSINMNLLKKYLKQTYNFAEDIWPEVQSKFGYDDVLIANELNPEHIT